jgi:hypothetical protein
MPLQLSILIGALFGALAALTASLIFHREYSRHRLPTREIWKLCIKAGAVAFAAFVALSAAARISVRAPGRLIRYARRIATIGIDDAEVRWNTRVEHAHILLLNDVEQFLALLLGDDELDLDGQRARQLEEVRFVNRVMSAETRDGAERRSTADTELVGPFEQPLPRGTMVNGLPLANVEPQE